MLAKVLKIKVGERVDVGGHWDEFVVPMEKKVGKTIEVFPMKGAKEWFVCNGGWKWHKNWLKMIPEVSDSREGEKGREYFFTARVVAPTEEIARDRLADIIVGKQSIGEDITEIFSLDVGLEM